MENYFWSILTVFVPLQLLPLSLGLCVHLFHTIVSDRSVRTLLFRDGGFSLASRSAVPMTSNLASKLTRLAARRLHSSPQLLISTIYRLDPAILAYSASVTTFILRKPSRCVKLYAYIWCRISAGRIPSSTSRPRVNTAFGEQQLTMAFGSTGSSADRAMCRLLLTPSFW